jgi:hypothetical protein
MRDLVIWLTPLAVLAIVLLFSFVGCTGEDPAIVAAQAKDDQKKIDDQKAQDAQKAAKYENVVAAAPGLVAYWRLSEGETGDTIAKDSVPAVPHNGQYQNAGGGGVVRSVLGALTLGKDPNDKAAEFDGVRGFVEVPHDGLLNPPLDFSIEAWIRPSDSPAQPEAVVGSYEIDAAGNVVRGFVLDVLASAGGLMLRGRVGSVSASTELQAPLGDGLEHDGWRHVVLTYSATAHVMKLYVNSDNGLPRAAPASSAPPVFYVANLSSPLRIAAGQASGSTPGWFFKGRIDEVALYNVEIPGSTVKDHFLHATAAV